MLDIISIPFDVISDLGSRDKKILLRVRPPKNIYLENIAYFHHLFITLD